MLAGCYPTFTEMVTSDYRARVRRVEGPAVANTCTPQVRERSDWSDGDDAVYEVGGCTIEPVLYECEDIYRTHTRSSVNASERDASCQPVLTATDR
jgi:hypothetical protein